MKSFQQLMTFMDKKQAMITILMVGRLVIILSVLFVAMLRQPFLADAKIVEKSGEK